MSKPLQKTKGSQKTYLHDEKVRVVNIKTNRTKEILYSGIVCIYSIDQIFISATYNHLKREVFLKINKQAYILAKIINSQIYYVYICVEV